MDFWRWIARKYRKICFIFIFSKAQVAVALLIGLIVNVTPKALYSFYPSE